MLIAFAAITGVLLFMRADDSALPPLPPPGNAPDGAPLAFEDFAGAEACAGCHAEQYAAWSRSTHGRAGGEPSPDLLVRAFDGRPIRFRDAVVTPARTRDGAHAFVISRPGRPDQVLTVDGVVGGAHMVGGGTQGFVTRHIDGTVRFLPFEMIRHEDVWFCNSNTRADQGWIPITPDIALADCGDWPPIRTLGNIPRYATCQECHGSQIEVAPAPGRPNQTRYVSLAINCESCHGPAAQHAEQMRTQSVNPSPRQPAPQTSPGNAVQSVSRATMPTLSTFSKDASLEICFRCHALKDAVGTGYLPGKSFEDFYSLRLPLLSDETVFADGRIRTFAYQQGHLWSDCYLSGSMTCVDCHEPHSQEYRDTFGRPLAGRFDDGQCTACHVSKADRLEQHTHHDAASPGSRCVACHMPYLQEPEVGDRLRYARSDHTIPVPRPAFDAGLGIEIACAACHRDRTAATLQADAQRWWGQLKPHHPLVAGLAAAGDQPDRATLIALLEIDAPPHRMAEFALLSALLRDHLDPDSSAVEDIVARRFREAALSDDPDFVALGLAALHWSHGNERAIRRFLIERMTNLGAAETAVRARWVVLLGFLGDMARQNRDPARAITAYRKALEVRPADAAVLMNLGLASIDSGDPLAAESAYLASIAADSLRSLAWVNLGIARAARGDEGGAIRAYDRALALDSADALASFNLGNIYLRADRPADALGPYQRATRHAPGMAEAHFNLARALIALDRLDEARIALRDGLEFDSDNAAAAQALEALTSRER
ncbi:MAG: tetratricopeptide repeat protein [Gemmatimonadetes bacterium]|nr:tetratricopeptide repeat protein [Gemmatimonadota bacterium]